MLWQNISLQFQTQLNSLVPLPETLFPCVHNAGNALQYMPHRYREFSLPGLVEVRLHNQILSIDEQLQLGVRRLAVDVHNVDHIGLVLCHANYETQQACEQVRKANLDCETLFGFPDFGLHTGCTSESLLFSEFLEIVNDNVGNELVIFDIESSMNTSASSLIDTFPPSLLDAIFTPLDRETWLANNATNSASWDNAVAREDLVKFPTSSEIVGMGRHIVMANRDFSNDAVGSAWFHSEISAPRYPFSTAIYFTSVADYMSGTSDTCGIMVNDQFYDMPVWFTHFTESDLEVSVNIPGLTPVSEIGSVINGDITASVARAMLRCGYTPCVDSFTATSAAWFVWTWAPSQFPIEGRCLAAGLMPPPPSQETTGEGSQTVDEEPDMFRWSSVECDTPRRFACQSTTDRLAWVVGDVAVVGVPLRPFSQFSALNLELNSTVMRLSGSEEGLVCPDGFEPGLPHSPREQIGLERAVRVWATTFGDAGVWLRPSEDVLGMLDDVVKRGGVAGDGDDGAFLSCAPPSAALSGSLLLIAVLCIVPFGCLLAVV